MRWATRRHCHIDRAACAWLIRRFIDPEAEFLFVDDADEVPEDATPFDMRGVELSHHDGDCSFEAFLLLIAIIGGVGWVRPARLVRGAVLSAREQGFVLAARGFGAGPVYLIRRHILPLTWGILLTQATLLIPQYILAEVTLSFLGLGVGEPMPSWGNMLSEARQFHALVTHPWLLAPGVAAIPVLLGYMILADNLLDLGNSLRTKT